MADREVIYTAAGLTQPEVDAIERCLDNDNQDTEVEISGFLKLQQHFCDAGEMPYAIASQSSWHPENTHTPDDWIIEQLSSV
jgi:hypothetical protein